MWRDIINSLYVKLQSWFVDQQGENGDQREKGVPMAGASYLYPFNPLSRNYDFAHVQFSLTTYMFFRHFFVTYSHEQKHKLQQNTWHLSVSIPQTGKAESSLSFFSFFGAPAPLLFYQVAS